MPMLFWYSAIIAAEIWCMAFAEMPSLTPRPRSLARKTAAAMRRAGRDVMLGAASKALIIGFNTKSESKSDESAAAEGVEIKHYSIIYEALDDVKLAMEGLLEAITQGLVAQPPEGAVSDNKQRRRREPSPAVIDLLKTLLRLRAEAAGVAPRLIANAEDIERLAANEDDGVAALSGWRAEVFGNDARLLRKGDLAIALENGEAVVVELEGE